MKTGSLRVRLLGLAGLTITIGLALAWIALTILFERHVQRRVEAELANGLVQIAAGLDASGPGIRLANEPADPRYQRPFGGLYWEVRPRSGEPLRSRSLWDETLPEPPAGSERPISYEAIGPERRRLILRAETLELSSSSGTREVDVLIGADRNELEEAVAGYGRDLAVALGVIGMCLAGATALQVGLGLAPLASLRGEIAAIRARRKFRLDPEVPREVRPLVEEVNELLHVQDEALTRARARAGDLAHALKTPLSVLSAVARGLARTGKQEEASEILAQVDVMRGRIDRQLTRARLGMDHLATSRIGTLAERLAGVMTRTERGEGLAWELRLDSDALIAADDVDVAEALGNVMDNAAKWARSKVRISTTAADRSVLAEVEDDGPGVPEPKLDEILARGLRLDPEAEGAGLGLSIVREIMDAYKGELTLGRSEMGGLRVALVFPRAAGEPTAATGAQGAPRP